MAGATRLMWSLRRVRQDELACRERSGAAVEEPRYHDLSVLAGEPGIAVTWPSDAGTVNVAFVLDRVARERVAYRAEVPDAGSPRRNVARALATVGERRDEPGEGACLRMVLPGPGGDALLGRGPQALAAQRARAREALRAAAMPVPMRQALHAVLDHGFPVDGDIPLHELRRIAAGQARDGAPPTFWDVVAFLADRPTLCGVLRLVDVVEGLLGGRPVTTVLEREFPGITHAHLDRLRSLPPDGAALFADERHGPFRRAMMQALGGVPPEWTPRDGEWDAFACVSYAVRRAALAVQRTDARAMLHGSRGDWRAFLGRAMDAAGLEGPDRLSPLGVTADRLEAVAADLADVSRTLTPSLTLPLLSHNARGRGTGGGPVGGIGASRLLASNLSERLLYGGKGLPAMLALSRRWHATANAIEAGAAGRPDMAWPPLLPGPFAVGAVEIVPVADARALREEGAPGPDRDGVPGLAHCVSSRLPALFSGDAHVLSLRERLPHGGWRRLSTAQVTVQATLAGHRLLVTEHRGRANGPPGDLAKAALDLLARRLGDGDLLPVPDALRRRLPQGDSVAQLCRYDWRDPEALTTAIRAWEPLLPRWARGHGPDGLLRACIAHGALPADWLDRAG